jgi:hypothetical protein
MKNTPPKPIVQSAPIIPPIARSGSATASAAVHPAAITSEEEMTQLLAPYQVESLGRTGILEKTAPPVKAPSPRDVSSREQWFVIIFVCWDLTSYFFRRILLIIVWCMGDRGYGVVEGGDPKEVKFSEQIGFDWFQKYLSFQTLLQARELLQNLMNDGFIMVSKRWRLIELTLLKECPTVDDRKMFGFHWQKIETWYGKNFTGKTPRSLSSSTSSMADKRDGKWCPCV